MILRPFPSAFLGGLPGSQFFDRYQVNVFRFGDAIRVFYGIKENGTTNTKGAQELTAEHDPQSSEHLVSQLTKIRKMLEFVKMSET